MVKIEPMGIASDAWQFVRAHLGMFAFVSFVALVIPAVLSSLSLPSDYFSTLRSGDMQRIAEMGERAQSGGSLMQIISLIVSSIVGVAVLNVVRIAVRNDEDPKFESAAMGVDVYVKAVAVNVIVLIAGYVGALFCLVPGVYILGRLNLAPLCVLNNPSSSISDAIKTCWNGTKDHAANLIILGLVNFFIQLAGLLCCCVGLLVTTGVQYTMEVMAYNQIFGEGEVPATQPVPAEEAKSKLDF